MFDYMFCFMVELAKLESAKELEGSKLIATYDL